MGDQQGQESTLNRKGQRHRQIYSTVLLVALAVLGYELTARAQDELLAKELPRIKPLSPAAAIASFRLHDGFALKSVAVEPTVVNPVSVCFDANGILYVVEMLGYPYPEQNPSGRVARLEDRDGDGCFEGADGFSRWSVVAYWDCPI